jgi:hypothetical protein
MRAANRKRRRVLFFVKIIVFLLILGNLGLLGWYVLRNKGGIRLGGPRAPLRAEPETISFGEVAAGKVLTKEVTIRNRTGRELDVAQIGFTGDSFRLKEAFAGLVLPPRGQTTLTVVYEPHVGGANDCEMQVRLRDGHGPCLRVPVRATALLPRLGVSRKALDFGDVTKTGGGRLALKIGNKGNAPLRITAITVQGEGFGLVEPFKPQALVSRQTIAVEVVFAPARMGASQGRLVIASTDPNEPEKAIALSASYRSAEGRDREIAQARALLDDAKRDLTTAYAMLTFESTNKSLMATRHQMGRTKFEEAWPKYERANEILRSIDPSLVDTEFYVDAEMNLHKRSAE